MSNLPAVLLLGALTAGTLILVFLVWLSLRAHRAGIGTTISPMVGLRGKAVTVVAAEGRVMVQGEYWWARSRTPVAEGQNVRVVGIDGLTLEVEPCPDKAVIPRPVSAIEPQGLQDT
jgi:membrane-bound serine protease (ClpP class)